MYSNPDTHTGGPELGFCRCFADGLNPQFSSVVYALICKDYYELDEQEKYMGRGV